MNKDQVIAKVRKLINLAQNAGASEGERDNAMSMAHKFLAKYNLQMAEIGTEEEAKDTRQDIVLEFKNNPANRRIANAIAKLYFCNYLYFRGTDRHMMVGREANVVTATEMATFVLDVAKACAGWYARDNGGGSSARTAYVHGVADAVVLRVREILEANRASENTPGTALALVNVYNAEAAANKEYLEKMLGMATKPGRTTKRNLRDADAYHKGVAKGKSVNLNNQLASG